MKIETLEQAVRNQLTGSIELGSSSEHVLRMVAEHGADGGYVGFTYYFDTVHFAERHIDLVREALLEDCEEYGYKTMSRFVITFACLKGDYQEEEINRCLYLADGTKNKEYYTPIMNALAWYALEKVAYDFVHKTQQETS